MPERDPEMIAKAAESEAARYTEVSEVIVESGMPNSMANFLLTKGTPDQAKKAVEAWKSMNYWECGGCSWGDPDAGNKPPTGATEAVEA
jgi:hypothetical protein